MGNILCGDSIDILGGMDNNIVDIVLTSPPYNFGMNYDNHDDSQSIDEYMNTLLAILGECYRLLKPGGRMIVNIQPDYRTYTPTHHLLTQGMMNMGAIWRGEIVWLKNNIKKLTAWGSWKSPSCPYLSYPFEFIEIFSKDDIKHTGDKENVDITKEEFIKFVNGHWTMAPETRMKKFNHPTMFPEELVERCLKLFSYRGDLVLDPFNGGGTTTYVALKLKRQCIGIDISPEYCKIAEDRMLGLRDSIGFFG